MKTTFSLILVSTLLLISCQEPQVKRPEPILKDNNNVSTVRNPVIDSPNRSNTDPYSPAAIASKRSQALSILNFRLKNDADYYTIIEEGVWELQFMHQGEMKQFDGEWYDFKKDHTYEYGKGAEVHGSGKYSYHFERSELLMVDNLTTKKPEEWSVQTSGDMMVLVGTPTYRDNHIQKKLVNQNQNFRE